MHLRVYFSLTLSLLATIIFVTVWLAVAKGANSRSSTDLRAPFVRLGNEKSIPISNGVWIHINFIRLTILPL